MPSAPPEIHEAAGRVLDGMDPLRRRTFALRLDRWWTDLIEPLTLLYGDQAPDLADTLIVAAATAFRDRSEELHELDERRLLEPDWFQQPSVIGYAAYADRFAGSLAGVGDHLDYLTELGVQYLLPIFTNALGTDDMEEVRVQLFHPGNLTNRFQSVNVDIQKKIQYLAPDGSCTLDVAGNRRIGSWSM